MKFMFPVVSLLALTLGACAAPAADRTETTDSKASVATTSNEFSTLKTFDVDATLSLGNVESGKIFINGDSNELELDLQRDPTSGVRDRSFALKIVSDNAAEGLRTVVARRDSRPVDGDLEEITLVASADGTTVTLVTDGYDRQDSKEIKTTSTFSGLALQPTPAVAYTCSNAAADHGYIVTLSQLNGAIVNATLSAETFFGANLLADYDTPETLLSIPEDRVRPFVSFHDTTIADGGYLIVAKKDSLTGKVLVDVSNVTIAGAKKFIKDLACRASDNANEVNN